MPKKIGGIVVFIAVFIGTCAICIGLSRSTPSIPANTEMPQDIANTMYVFSGWQNTRQGDRYTLQISNAGSAPPVSLVLCEMDTFTVFQDGRPLYHYDRADGSQRTNTVPLRQADMLHIQIEAASIHMSRSIEPFAGGMQFSSIMIASAHNASHMDTLALAANGATMGFYLLIIVYSLSLYMRKRSENYLLLLCGLALLALLSGLTNSNIILWNVAPIANYIRYFRVVFCMSLTFHLLGICLPGRFRYILGWQGVLLLTAAVIALDLFGLAVISNAICYFMMIPPLLACALAIWRAAPGAYMLAICVAIREGLRLFLLILLELPLQEPLLLPPAIHYYYLPQLSSLVFAVGCVLVVNNRFATMFNKADMLVLELEKANAELDTKVRRRTAELHAANESLKLEQARKQGIMTNIFHDLRTPIFCAQGSAEMVRVADAKSRERMHVLKDRLDFLAHMVEGLFALANLEDTDIQFEMFRLKAETFCRTITDAFVVLAAQKAQAFHCSIAPDVYFAADAYRMKSALENLLLNAIKYTQDGGTIVFRVYARKMEACFEVQDNGPGIAPDELQYVFDRYYHSRLHKRENSTGLGLSITRVIVEKHGGSIAVESELCKGTTFTIRLPLENAPLPEVGTGA